MSARNLHSFCHQQRPVTAFPTEKRSTKDHIQESLTPDIISEKRSIKDSQPPLQKEMVVEKGGNRNAKNITVDDDGLREWSFGLFSCCGQPQLCTFRLEIIFVSLTLLGCVASFCPCVIQAQNERRLEYLARHGTPDPQRRTFCVGETLTYGVIDLITNVGWALQVRFRFSPLRTS